MQKRKNTMSKLPIDSQNPAAADEREQGPIQPFLYWINHIEIPSVPEDHTQGTRGTARRSSSFTNGPYAELKESIGQLIPKKSQEN